MATAPGGRGSKRTPAPSPQRGVGRVDRLKGQTDDCELSYDEGQLRVAFFRGDTLIYRLLLDPPGALRLADRLENRSESRDVKLAGGVLMNRASARSVAHQLRGLAGMLRVAPQLFEGLRPLEPAAAGSRAAVEHAAVVRVAVEHAAVVRPPVERRSVERAAVDRAAVDRAPVDDDPEEAAR